MKSDNVNEVLELLKAFKDAEDKPGLGEENPVIASYKELEKCKKEVVRQAFDRLEEGEKLAIAKKMATYEAKYNISKYTEFLRVSGRLSSLVIRHFVVTQFKVPPKIEDNATIVGVREEYKEQQVPGAVMDLILYVYDDLREQGVKKEEVCGMIEFSILRPRYSEVLSGIVAEKMQTSSSKSAIKPDAVKEELRPVEKPNDIIAIFKTLNKAELIENIVGTQKIAKIEEAKKSESERVQEIQKLNNHWGDTDKEKARKNIKAEFDKLTDQQLKNIFTPSLKGVAANPFMWAMLRGDRELFEYFQTKYKEAYPEKPLVLKEFIFDSNVGGQSKSFLVDGQDRPEQLDNLEYFRGVISDVAKSCTTEEINEKRLLNIAAFFGNKEAVEHCLAQPGIDVFAKGSRNKSAVVTSVNHQDIRGEVAKLILSHVFDKMQAASEGEKQRLGNELSQSGALKYVIEMGSDELVKLLFDRSKKVGFMYSPNIADTRIIFSQVLSVSIGNNPRMNQGQCIDRLKSFIDHYDHDFYSLFGKELKKEGSLSEFKTQMDTLFSFFPSAKSIIEYTINKSFVNAINSLEGNFELEAMALVLKHDKEYGEKIIDQLQSIVDHDPDKHVKLSKLLNIYHNGIKETKEVSYNNEKIFDAVNKMTQALDCSKELGITTAHDVKAVFELAQEIAAADIKGLKGVNVQKAATGFTVKASMEKGKSVTFHLNESAEVEDFEKALKKSQSFLHRIFSKADEGGRGK